MIFKAWSSQTEGKACCGRLVDNTKGVCYQMVGNGLGIKSKRVCEVTQYKHGPYAVNDFATLRTDKDGDVGRLSIFGADLRVTKIAKQRARFSSVLFYTSDDNFGYICHWMCGVHCDERESIVDLCKREFPSTYTILKPYEATHRFEFWSNGQVVAYPAQGQGVFLNTPQLTVSVWEKRRDVGVNGVLSEFRSWLDVVLAGAIPDIHSMIDWDSKHTTNSLYDEMAKDDMIAAGTWGKPEQVEPDEYEDED